MPPKNELAFNDMPFHYSVEVNGQGRVISEKLVVRGVDLTRFVSNVTELRKEFFSLNEKTPPEENKGVTEPERTCPLHGVPMKQYTQHGEIWFSHKTPDGAWCKGKEK